MNSFSFSRFLRPVGIAAFLTIPLCLTQIAAQQPNAVEVQTSVESFDVHFRSSQFGKAGMTVKLLLSPNSKKRLLKGNDQTVRAKDAAGRVLTGNYKSFFSEEREDGSLLAFLHFDQPPQGGWLAVKADLRMALAAGEKELPLLTVPMGEKGFFELGGVRFEYGESAGFSFPMDEDSKEAPAVLTLSFPEDAPVASFAFRDERGQELRLSGTSTSTGMGKTVTFTFSASPGKKVGVIVNLQEGIEQVVVPLKLKLELGGVVSEAK